MSETALDFQHYLPLGLSDTELHDLIECADERQISVLDLVRKAVLDDLAR